MHVIKPTLLLDENRCKSNIHRAVEKAKKHNLIFRPHFKTHQSHEIGNWFREAGVEKVTVSSIGMAQYFAENGWTDITVAFPVNILEIKLINQLVSRIKLKLLVESIESINLLSNQLDHPVGVFIKTDFGYHRTGVDAHNVELIRNLIKIIKASQKLRFEGILTHAGNSYDCRGKEAVIKLHLSYLKSINTLRSALHDIPDLYISYGDTPTCSVADDFAGINEIRPGNFVFYDLTQTLIGSCSINDIAVAMICPVVAKHPERNEAIIYGGGIHFSKDRIIEGDNTIWGRVVRDQGDNWGEVIEGVYLKKLSQEHGTITGSKEYIESLEIGQLVKILPVHSCMTADCMKRYSTTSGETIQMYNHTA